MTFSIELVAMVFYAILLVWFASKLHSAVLSLTEAVRELKALYGKVANDIGGLSTRTSLLEDFRGRVEKALATAPHVDWGRDA